MSNTRKSPAKAGIYFSHYECFGHTSRVMAIGEVFKNRFPEGKLFFIQAGVQQPQSKLDQQGRVYLLPSAFMDRRQFKEAMLRAGADTGQRSQACVEIIAQEQPELFITEFFPLGREECRHELIPSLAKLSAKGVALWAAAGYPLLTGADHQWREKILELYEKIIIFSSPEEKQLIADSFPDESRKQKYLEFFERHASKIVFAGYLLPQQEVVRDDENNNLPKPPVPKGACRVTVLRGGGAVYPKIIAEAIRSSDLLGPEYYMTVVAGPSTTPQEWYFFATLFGKKKVHNLALHRAVGNYEQLIREGDVCVAMPAYHTSAMLLKHQKKAVLIPFEGYGTMSFYEQPARAAMLREKIRAVVLPIQDLTASSLTAKIKEAAAGRNITTQIPKEWFGGTGFLEQSLTGLFGQ